ncbi:hypothetical protein, partial [Pseudomonas aeruginosa]|uniref:hypothetical protein n=1 Tax=Pseudomonas aeruginosa TaxID=287 RepID=UPI001CA57DC6
MDDSELYRSLCEILGARGVRDSAALAGQDPGYHPQNLAGSFLVLPESTDQVAAVVRLCLSLIHISEPTRHSLISYALFCLKKKKYKSSLS